MGSDACLVVVDATHLRGRKNRVPQLAQMSLFVLLAAHSLDSMLMMDVVYRFSSDAARDYSYNKFVEAMHTAMKCLFLASCCFSVTAQT